MMPLVEKGSLVMSLKEDIDRGDDFFAQGKFEQALAHYTSSMDDPK